MMRRVSEHYSSACATRAVMQKLTVNPNEAQYRAVKQVIKGLHDGLNKQVCLDLFKADLEKGLDARQFAFDWQLSGRVGDDTACMSRFLDYLGDRKIIALSVPVNAADLEMTVDFVTEAGGVYEAFIVRWKKADKSLKGKSIHTDARTDLYALVAKAGLEERYPGILINLVFMRNENDTAGHVTSFVISPTRKSNIFSMSFENFYEGGVFLKSEFMAEIGRVVNEPLEMDCFGCPCKDACTAKTAQQPVMETYETPATSWQMPEHYTEAQRSVINLVDGPAVVCAGPGSGKTATLVGRMRHLIEDEEIDPEFILAITFTRDAAGELLLRCRSFCEEDAMPKIMTLNAFGFMLLNNNPDYTGGVKKLLGKRERQKLLKNLLDAGEPLQGFSTNVLYGQNGLLATLDRKIQAYAESPDEFMSRNPAIKDDFKRFASTFLTAVEEHGYISYDEQITLATKLLKEHPEVFTAVTSRYKYIMVDEFQDIDREQAELIYLIAKNRNLVVVGDDDQSIYGFRGGSNRYMLEFEKYFPEAQKIVLTENFRSTQNLVDEANGFISRNKRRIAKDVRSVRGAGAKTAIRQGRDASDVDRAVKELQGKGFALSDIVVLATKNATLEDLARNVQFKAVLGKSYLIQSVLFKCVYHTLALSRGYDDAHLLNALFTLGVSVEELPKERDGLMSLYLSGNGLKAASTLKSWLTLINEDCSVSELLDTIASDIGYRDTADLKALYELIETRRDDKDLDSLSELLEDMVNFEDDTRLECVAEDAVLLITSHESKGMEWRAVILVDDFKADGSEETNRLYYVAMTRAKDALIVLTDGQTLLNKAI